MVFREKIKKTDKHEFAFYYADITSIAQQGRNCSLSDSELVHRVVRIVKIAVDEHFVLFNQQQQVTVSLVSCSKREIVIDVIKVQQNQELKPHIIFLLPMLKRDNLETAVYSLAELGVNEIQLVITQKSRQKAISQKELQRLCKVAISAAEQSKHFAFPVIKEPQPLQDYSSSLDKNRNKIVFDAAGVSFDGLKSALKYTDHYLLVGPEGGLTAEESEFLSVQGFIKSALTSTVLRAVQAVSVGTSLFRLR